MVSVYDLYEFYLDPHDLKDKAHVVTVESVRVDSVINPRAHKPEKKIVLRFVNRRKSMILNKTQAGAMMELAGTDDYTKWKGVEVVLVAGRASNGKDTIQITSREESGDLDLMFPPKDEPAKPRNIPVNFWEATSDEAVDFASKRWGTTKAKARKFLSATVKNEALSDPVPEREFKAYVEMCAIGDMLVEITRDMDD